MRSYYLPLLAAAVLGLTACGDDSAEVAERPEGGVDWAEPDQLHRAQNTDTPDRAEVGPQKRLQQFFSALRADQPEQAAALVAREPAGVDEQQLIEEIRQWAGRTAAAQQEFRILDSEQTGDFAIVRAQFTSMDDPGGTPAVRPVVMFLEEGEWKVVWELLGLEPERVADVDPASAQRLEPLYDWYSKRQLYDTQQAGQPAATGSDGQSQIQGLESESIQQPGQSAWPSDDSQG